MARSPVITVVFEDVFLALTPIERWQSARKFTLDLTPQRWMILVGVVALIMMVVLFSWVSISRARRVKKNTGKSFVELGRQRGLSVRERQLLAIVAQRAGLRRAESVFTMGSAFGMGAARVIEEGLGGEQTAEQSEQLKTEIAFLREKLGFVKRRSSLAGAPARSKELSSRQIPEGKQLYITRRKARASIDIESTVIRNDETELAIKLSSPVKVTFGEPWCVRYYSGASVWEFDTSVISYDGDTMVLNHSDNVRFVNRRRFLRVPVRMRAFVAQFPFTRTLDETGAAQGEQAGAELDLPDASGWAWCPPRFVPAVVTELAGPGLRIESALEAKEGERILVVLSLDEADSGDLMRGSARDKGMTVKIVEDIGEVRHIKAVTNGFSIAVELTGLSDSDVDELICATNAASLRAGAGDKGVPVSVSEQERIGEPSVAQGV